MIAQETDRARVEDRDVDLVMLARHVWRFRLSLAIWAVFGAALAAGSGAFLATPVYEAEARVALETRAPQIVGFETVLPGLGGDAATMATELEALRAPRFAEALALDLGLAENPAFNPALAANGPFERVRARLGLAAGPPDTSGESAQQAALASAREAVERALSVEMVRHARVFSIVARSEDPALSAALANGLAERYLEDQLAQKSDARRAAAEWLELRIETLRAEVAEAERKVQSHALAHDLVSAEELADRNRTLRDLRARADQLAAAGSASPRSGQLAETIAEAERMIARRSEALLTLDRLEREAVAARDLYAHFFNRLKEMEVQEGLQRPDARILSAAIAPRAPASPRPARLALAGGLAGFALGAFLALWRLAARRGMGSATEVEAATDRPVLGLLPTLPVRGPADVSDHLAANPGAPLAEAMRGLRTALMQAHPVGLPRVTLVTSALPDEGKTTLALALSQSLSLLGRRVLLVEADVRRLSLARGLPEAAGRPGLGSVLEGRARPEDAIFRADRLGIDILAGDPPERSAADLFGSPALEAFLREMRGRYGAVVLDAPPVLSVADARILAPRADAVVMALRWETTPEEDLAEALRQIEAGGGRVRGLAITRVAERALRRYGYRAYAYGAYAA